MYTQAHCIEQIPGIAKRLNALIKSSGSGTRIRVTIADEAYDVTVVASDGHITLLAGAQSPLQTWRLLNRLLDYQALVNTDILY